MLLTMATGGLPWMIKSYHALAVHARIPRREFVSGFRQSTKWLHCVETVPALSITVVKYYVFTGRAVQLPQPMSKSIPRIIARHRSRRRREKQKNSPLGI